MQIKDFKKPLKLTNTGQLEIVFIGTGTPFSRTLYNNNFFIIKGETHILVDFGMTGPVALSDIAGLDVTNIKTILPTHSHADHIGGIEYLALYHRYVTQRNVKKPKIEMIISEEYEKILWEMSLRGGLEWNESNSSGKKMKFSDYFEPVRPKLITNSPRHILEIDYKGIHIELFGTNHIPDNARTQKQAFLTFGLFIDKKVMISGDTKFDRKLIEMYSNKAEILFHDASFLHNPVHASVEELRELPSEVKKKMYLMHYTDDWQKYKVADFGGLAHQGIKYTFK
jgi:hydroxyacylglutathione hydrolase